MRILRSTKTKFCHRKTVKTPSIKLKLDIKLGQKELRFIRKTKKVKNPIEVNKKIPKSKYSIVFKHFEVQLLFILFVRTKFKSSKQMWEAGVNASKVNFLSE